MAINYVPLDKNVHKDTKILTGKDYTFSAQAHISAATIREFPQLAACTPIVFIKDSGNDTVHAVAMLGVEQGQNLYVHEGKWQAPHVPMNIQRYPFDIRPDGDKLGLFIDENSPLINADGTALFQEDGEASPLLQQSLQFMDFLANSEKLTAEFVKRVVELDLLSELELRMVTVSGERKAVKGMMGINEAKLFDLADDVVLELHKKGFMGALYAIMLSLGQINRVVELSNNTDQPIRSLQVVNLDQEAAAKAKAEAEQQAE